MKWRVATTFIAALGTAASGAAWAQSAPPQCAAFLQLRTEAQDKASAVRKAIDKKVERKEVCTLVQRFYAAEGTVVKFLEDNKTWCNIPDQAITRGQGKSRTHPEIPHCGLHRGSAGETSAAIAQRRHRHALG